MSNEKVYKIKIFKFGDFDIKSNEKDINGMQCNISHEGASTIKWISPYPCKGLSKSDSKLYTN